MILAGIAIDESDGEVEGDFFLEVFYPLSFG